MGKQQGDRGRFSAQKKSDAVLRLLRGEDLDIVSREIGVTAGTLADWREKSLEQGQRGLRARNAEDDRDAEILRLKAKIGEITMSNELLREANDRLRNGLPFDTRRPKK